MEDGEILVLGGLMDETMRDTVQKVPILGDIPLLGWLFRSHTTTKDKQNLMVFMRPSIMRDQYSAQQQTHEKYNYLRAQQIQAGKEGFGLMTEENSPLLPELKAPAQKEKQPDKPEANMIEDDDEDFF